MAEPCQLLGQRRRGPPATDSSIGRGWTPETVAGPALVMITITISHFNDLANIELRTRCRQRSAELHGGDRTRWGARCHLLSTWLTMC